MFNTLYRTTKYLIFTLLLCLPFSAPAFNPLGAPPSPEDLKKMGMGEDDIKALQELQKQVESLSDEEKAQLQKAVEETVEKIGKMSDDELKKFAEELDTAKSEEDFEKIFGNYFEDVKPPVPSKPAPTMPTKPKVEPKKGKPLAPIATTKQQKTINTINNIVHLTDSFFIKISSSADMGHKIERWIDKSKIHTANRSWNQLQQEIHAFAQLLRKSVSQEAKSKEYKFIDELIKNESAINGLEKINSALTSFEPQIQEASPYQVEPLSDKSKEAIKRVMAQYVEALTVLKLPDVLVKAIAAYEPRAKEIAQYEEQMKSRALQESKKPRYPGRVVTVGQEVQEPKRPTYPTPSAGLGRQGSGFGGGVTGGLGGKPSQQPTALGSGGSSPSKSGALGSGKSDSKDKDKDKDKTEDKDKDKAKDKDKKIEDAKKSGKPGEIKKESDKKDGEKPSGAPTLDKVFEEGIKEFDKKVEEINKLAAKSAPLRSLKEHVMSKDPVDKEFATEHLPKFKELVQKTSDIVKSVENNAKMSKLGTAERKMIQGKLDQSMKKHPHAKNVFDQFKRLEKATEEELMKISPEKLYAYIGIGAENIMQTKQLQDLTQKLPKADQDAFAKAIKEKNRSEIVQLTFKAIKPTLSPSETEQINALLKENKLSEAEQMLGQAAAARAPKTELPDAFKKLMAEVPQPVSIPTIGEQLKATHDIIENLHKEPKKDDEKKKEPAKVGPRPF